LVWLLGYSLKEETSKEEEEDVLWFAIPWQALQTYDLQQMETYIYNCCGM
jgi:hypothetical protein